MSFRNLTFQVFAHLSNVTAKHLSFQPDFPVLIMHPPWLVLLQLWILSSPAESSVKVTSISSDRTVTFSTLSQAYHFRSKVLVSLDLQTTAAKQSKTMVGSFLSMTPVWLKYLTENTLSGLHFHESELDVLQEQASKFLTSAVPSVPDSFQTLLTTITQKVSNLSKRDTSPPFPRLTWYKPSAKRAAPPPPFSTPSDPIDLTYLTPLIVSAANRTNPDYDTDWSTDYDLDDFTDRLRRDASDDPYTPYTEAESDNDFYTNLIQDHDASFHLPDDALAQEETFTEISEIPLEIETAANDGNKSTVRETINKQTRLIAAKFQPQASDYYHGLLELASGQPAPLLLNLAACDKHLLHLSGQLSQFHLSLATVRSKELFLYPFSVVTANDEYYLVFEIPIIEKQARSQVLSPTKYDFIIPSFSGHYLLQPKLEADLLLTTDTPTAVTYSQLAAHCWYIKQVYYCTRLPTPVNGSPCLSALYQSKANVISQACHFDISSHDPLVSRLTDKSFLYAAKNPSRFTATCNGSPKQQTVPAGLSSIDLGDCESFVDGALKLTREHLHNVTLFTRSIDTDVLLADLMNTGNHETIYQAYLSRSKDIVPASDLKQLSTADMILPDASDIDAVLTSTCTTMGIFLSSLLLKVLCVRCRRRTNPIP